MTIKFGLPTSENKCFDCNQLGLFSTLPIHHHCRWDRPKYEVNDIVSVKNMPAYIVGVNNESSFLQCSSLISSPYRYFYAPYHLIDFVIAKYQSPNYYKMRGVFN